MNRLKVRLRWLETDMHIRVNNASFVTKRWQGILQKVHKTEQLKTGLLFCKKRDAQIALILRKIGRLSQSKKELFRKVILFSIKLKIHIHRLVN